MKLQTRVIGFILFSSVATYAQGQCTGPRCNQGSAPQSVLPQSWLDAAPLVPASETKPGSEATPAETTAEATDGSPAATHNPEDENARSAAEIYDRVSQANPGATPAQLIAKLEEELKGMPEDKAKKIRGAILGSQPALSEFRKSEIDRLAKLTEKKPEQDPTGGPGIAPPGGPGGPGGGGPKEDPRIAELEKENEQLKKEKEQEQQRQREEERQRQQQALADAAAKAAQQAADKKPTAQAAAALVNIPTLNALPQMPAAPVVADVKVDLATVVAVKAAMAAAAAPLLQSYAQAATSAVVGVATSLPIPEVRSATVRASDRLLVVRAPASLRPRARSR